MVLALEDVEGREPSLPWRPDELDRVLAAVEELHTALTPSPVDAGSAGAVLEEKVNARVLAADTPAELDQWSQRHLDELVELEGAVADAVAGDTLLFISISVRTTSSSQASASTSSTGRMRRSARLGSTSSRSLPASPCRVAGARGPAAEVVGCGRGGSARLSAAVASVAGFFTYRALLPPPPGLPTLRSFQAAQGEVARHRLAQRTGWESADHLALGRPASARGGSTAAACAARSTRASRPSSPRDAGSQRSPCSDSRARSGAAPLAHAPSARRARVAHRLVRVEGVEHEPGEPRREDRVAFRNACDRLGQVVARDRLRHVARAPARTTAITSSAASDTDSARNRTRPLRRDACDHRLATAVREMDVEQHHVRVGLDDQRDRLGDAAGLADDVDSLAEPGLTPVRNRAWSSTITTRVMTTRQRSARPRCLLRARS